MKITMITLYWKNSHGGGVKTYLINLVNELNKIQDIQTNVIFREGHDPENYHVGGTKLSFAINSFSILKKIKPDVIHSHGTWYCLLAGYIYKKMYPVILVHTFHSEPRGNLSFMKRRFFQILLNSCDTVTFVSGGLLKQTKKVTKLKFKTTAITYAGVKHREVTEKEINAFKDKFEIGERSLVLLVQAFTANKLKAEGTQLVISAVKIIKKTYPNVILILTRDGFYSKDLKRFTRLNNVCNNVIFTGDVENPYVPLAICDIFIHPWLGIGNISLVLLEAMSMGKAIIATDISGTPGAIKDGENGLLIEPDVDAIVEKTDYLLSNKKYAVQLGENAKKTVNENYTWEKTINDFIYIYSNSKIHPKFDRFYSLLRK